jgi:hypothetical protein
MGATLTTEADAVAATDAANTMDASVFNMMIFLFERGRSEIACPLDGRTNDPGGRRKQIQLQYAGIGGSYGWASEAPRCGDF